MATASAASAAASAAALATATAATVAYRYRYLGTPTIDLCIQVQWYRLPWYAYAPGIGLETSVTHIGTYVPVLLIGS